MEKKKTDTLPMGGDASEALTALRELRRTVRRMMATYRGNDLALAYDLISDAAAELTEKALIAAKKHGVKVSVDLNFRKKLWSSEKAQKVMTNLMKYVDVCIGNEEDAELCLGFKPDADVEGGKTDAEGRLQIHQDIRQRAQ